MPKLKAFEAKVFFKKNLASNVTQIVIIMAQSEFAAAVAANQLVCLVP